MNVCRSPFLLIPHYRYWSSNVIAFESSVFPQKSGHSILMCATQCLFVPPRNCKPFLISNFSSFGKKTNSNAHRWHSCNHDIYFSHKISNWFVVSNIFHVHPYLEKIPNLTVRIFFQRGWFKTTNKTNTRPFSTIDYLRVLIIEIEIGSTIILMVVEAQGIASIFFIWLLLSGLPNSQRNVARLLRGRSTRNLRSWWMKRVASLMSIWRWKTSW